MARLAFLLAVGAIVFLAFGSPAVAHPPVGIVIAPNGEVFYSDLTHVWRVDRSGKKHIAVPNVHAHELAIDSEGAVYGEDSRWLGGDRYRHRIWKRAANGRITDVVPWTEGFWRDYGFTRDASGAMYWVKCTPARVCSVYTRNQQGRVRSIVSQGRFNNPVNWIAASPAGDVYVIDGPDLRRVRRGKVETFARISSRADGRHHLMGVSLDKAGNIYIAAHADRAVVRVSANRQVQTIARSAAPWAPSGVAVAPTGDLWILEWGGTSARVRRVSPRGVSTVY